MGLDMYLTKINYVGQECEYNTRTGFKVESKIPAIKSERISEVVEEVAYWRKANQIHKWFVDNIQDGNDDCREYDVTIEDIEELLSLCEKVLETKNTGLLPLQEGFFFGSMEIDEYYWKDIKYTIDTLKTVIAEATEPPVEGMFVSYRYRASW